MKISVITPTSDREIFLNSTYQLLKAQSHTNWEWLIYDTSLKPTHFSDARITYIYDPADLSIGEKRNRLIEKSSGDVIVHFDDDDYYAATYLERILYYLREASFFTMHAWFSYDLKTDQFFYWNTEELGEVSYCLSSLLGSRIREIDLGPYMQKQREALNYKGKAGYGFSFAYTKEVARTCAFQDIDLGEDRNFYEDAEKAGFIICTVADQKGEVIHMIHDSNTSTEFPQYRIPKFLLHSLFPPFFTHLDKISSPDFSHFFEKNRRSVT